MKDKKITKLIIMLIIIFFLFLILNILTPIIADDFGYALNLDKNHLRGIKDIINFQIVHYNTWGGRSVAHTIVQLFLMLPKWVFNICNSFCFTYLVYLIYRISKNNKKDNPILILFIFLILYFITPVFGQNTLWLTGSANYLWTTTIVLFLISIFMGDLNVNNNTFFSCFTFLLGICAGWTNENTAFGLIVILSLLTIKDKIKTKKVSSWKITGVLGSILGFIIMILAPGNYIRKDGYVEEISFFEKLINRFINCTTGIFKYLLPLICALVVFLIIYKYKNKKINVNALIFLIGSIFTVYPMVLSPTFPERSWFSIIIFFLIGILILFNDLDFSKKVKKYFGVVIIIVLLSFSIDYCFLIKDISKLNEVWKERFVYINKHKEDSEILLSPYETKNRKNPLYGQLDISKNPHDWPNNTIENYFKVKSIGLK